MTSSALAQPDRIDTRPTSIRPTIIRFMSVTRAGARCAGAIEHDFQPVRGLYRAPGSAQRDAAEGLIGIMHSDLIKTALIALSECLLVRQRLGAGARPRSRGSWRRR